MLDQWVETDLSLNAIADLSGFWCATWNVQTTRERLVKMSENTRACRRAGSMMATRPSSSVVASLGLVLLLVVSAPVFANSAVSREVVFDIPAQPVQSALLLFGAQADVQVMVGEIDLQGKSANAVKGRLNVGSALGRLLQHTGLTFIAEGNTVVVTAAQTMSSATTRSSELNKVAFVTEESSERLSVPQSAMGPSDSPFIEVLVTGSRLRQSAEDAPATITILDREKIDSLGASSVPEVLRYLPQQPYGRESGFLGSGAQFAELRGLGVDTTLVLINGRRSVPSAVNVTSNAFDLNSIPLSAVERIEVLSDSASAIYGADAMGGVINVILKDDIPDPVIDLSYGAADGGADERRASLSGGFSTERLRTSLVLDYFDRTSLLGRERDRWNNQDFRRFGSMDNRFPTANPGNIVSAGLGNLPGLSSPIAAVPPGSSGVGLTPADFEATAGQENLESVLKYWSIVPESERRSAAAFAQFDLGPRSQFFAEALYADRSTRYQSEPDSLFFGYVPASNAFNPFGEGVFANYLFTGIGPMITQYDSELLRGVAGLRGPLGGWDWEVSMLSTEEDGESWTKNRTDPMRVAAALASSDPSQALNVFADGPGGSPELLRSLVAPATINRFSSNGLQVSGFLRGSPFSMPFGDVEVVIGAEWREEEIGFQEFLFVEADRNVSASYVEAQVPLLKGFTAVQSLALTVAARYDDYSDFGGTLNPQYSLAWRPVNDLNVRMSYGTAFRPPSLFELYAPRTPVPSTINDPRRNNEPTSYTLLSGGNPDLEPLEGSSYTFGVVYTPSALKGLRLSASVWRIDLNDRVALFSPSLILVNEGDFPERVTRAAPTPAELAAGLPGRLLSVDSSRINFGTIETRGLDLDLSYVFTTMLGRFTTGLSGTWVGSYNSAELPGAGAQDRLGVANFNGTIVKWRGVATLGWNRGGVSLTALARYGSHYDDATFFAGPTGNTVSAQTLVDLQGAIDFGDMLSLTQGPIHGLKLSLGINNVFDEEPEFSEIGSLAGYDRSQGDLRQRFGYLKLTKTF